MTKFSLLAAGAALLLATPAHAIQIVALGQTSNSNTVTAVANGTSSTNVVANAGISISQLFGQATPITAFFQLAANSTDNAQTVLGLAVQHFTGAFCLSASAGCGGTKYLYGTFTDAAIGALGGPGLVVNASNPPDSLILNSDVISAAMLAAPNTFNLTFSNVSPALAICGNTLCGFTASFSGTASASQRDVNQTPEPASLMIMGAGLLGLAFLLRGNKTKLSLA